MARAPRRAGIPRRRLPASARGGGQIGRGGWTRGGAPPTRGGLPAGGPPPRDGGLRAESPARRSRRRGPPPPPFPPPREGGGGDSQGSGGSLSRRRSRSCPSASSSARRSPLPTTRAPTSTSARRSWRAVWSTLTASIATLISRAAITQLLASSCRVDILKLREREKEREAALDAHQKVR
ncbi:unnamed protein product [Phytomonas sp. EM1]|nr:unnamed protein product [Phytomonas sp. EM1]|eukprot:CCW65071.1 unnamed protein product [Phytomonas sp. isolate EM1]